MKSKRLLHNWNTERNWKGGEILSKTERIICLCYFVMALDKFVAL